MPPIQIWLPTGKHHVRLDVQDLLHAVEGEHEAGDDAQERIGVLGAGSRAVVQGNLYEPCARSYHEPSPARGIVPSCTRAPASCPRTPAARSPTPSTPAWPTASTCTARSRSPTGTSRARSSPRCTRCSRPSPSSLAAHNDAIAERAVTLGGKAYGTARHVAKTLAAARVPAGDDARPRAREAARRAHRDLPRRRARVARRRPRSSATPTPSTC